MSWCLRSCPACGSNIYAGVQENPAYLLTCFKCGSPWRQQDNLDLLPLASQQFSTGQKSPHPGSMVRESAYLDPEHPRRDPGFLG